MQVRGAGRSSAIWASAVFLLILAGALVFSRRHGAPEPSRVLQDVPAAMQLPRPAAPKRSPHSERSEGVLSAEDGARAGRSTNGGAALSAELLSNRQAIRDIDSMIGESDAGAEKLRSQIARQDDTISAQKQALATASASDTEQGDAQAALTAAVQMNDAARASLARYETTRSTLLEKSTALQRRNAAIADQLKR